MFRSNQRKFLKKYPKNSCAITSKPFHERFTENPDKVSNTELLKTIISSTIASVKSYHINGPPVSQWPQSYHVAVEVTKAITNTLISNQTIPSLHTFQEKSKSKTPVPRDAKIDIEFFTPQNKVIEFLKQNAPADWPKVTEDMNDIYGEWISTSNVDQDYVVYLLHGGGYLGGSIQLHRNVAYEISKSSQSLVYGINYRTAPQNPYPCAVIDAVSGYLHLIDKYHPKKIVIAGDSAGGGLALATMMVLRDMNVPLPAGGYTISPWCDLTGMFTNHKEPYELDYIPTVPDDIRLGNRLHYYIPDDHADIPYASPLLQDNFNDLPPILIQCGSLEKLYAEITAYYNKCTQGGQLAQLEIYEDHVHVFPLLRFPKASKIAFTRGGDWIQSISGRKNEPFSSKVLKFNFDGEHSPFQ